MAAGDLATTSTSVIYFSSTTAGTYYSSGNCWVALDEPVLGYALWSNPVPYVDPDLEMDIGL